MSHAEKRSGQKGFQMRGMVPVVRDHNSGCAEHTCQAHWNSIRRRKPNRGGFSDLDPGKLWHACTKLVFHTRLRSGSAAAGACAGAQGSKLGQERGKVANCNHRLTEWCSGVKGPLSFSRECGHQEIPKWSRTRCNHLRQVGVGNRAPNGG
jgi:hypothetical protein